MSFPDVDFVALNPLRSKLFPSNCINMHPTSSFFTFCISHKSKYLFCKIESDFDSHYVVSTSSTKTNFAYDLVTLFDYE